MGPKELALLQQRATGAVAAPPPFQSALDALKAATPAQYLPHALRDILVEWDKNGVPGKRIGKLAQYNAQAQGAVTPIDRYPSQQVV
jgi:hypothetical protein